MSQSPENPLLESPLPLRVAITRPNGPLIVPLWFEYREGVFWCASQAESFCVKALQAEPGCAFDLSTNDMPYRGLRGRGVAVCHPEQGARQLERLLLRYLGTLDAPLARRLRRKDATEVAIAITPLWTRTWDFTERMRDSLPR
ncbi:MAG: hypothetical protein RL434_747 [Pseudomonadota bacterium]|jgi:hypothetical protein